MEKGSVANGEPIAGPEGLESITVTWCASDGLVPGSSVSHLYKLLRPSLGTLMELELHDYPILDFLAFGPPCMSLCMLKYTTYIQSPKALEAVSQMFPNITRLELVFLAYPWMVCQIGKIGRSHT